MRHSELLILSVISVVIVLLAQTVVSLIGNDLLSFDFADLTYSSTGLTLVSAVAIAALIEESVRTIILYYYGRLKGIPRHFWLYGATFGFGFGFTEVLLAFSQASTPWHYVGLAGILLIHIILSIFAVQLLTYFTHLRIILTIILLVVVHSLYNLFVLVVLPLFGA